jgi:hypothetical protein
MCLPNKTTERLAVRPDDASACRALTIFNLRGGQR